MNVNPIYSEREQELNKEHILNLLNSLDGIKKRIHSEEECDPKEIESIEKCFKDLTVDKKFSIYIEATISELKGKLMERSGKYELARSKYQDAAEKLVKWVDMTSSDLIGKSILSKATKSIEEARESYEELKEYIKGVEKTRIIYFFQDLTNPQIEGQISKKTEKDIPEIGKIALKLIEMGDLKIAFTLIKLSVFDRKRMLIDILDLSMRFAKKGDKEKSINIIKSVYKDSLTLFNFLDQCDVLVKTALKCDELESDIALEVRDNIFNKLFNSFIDIHRFYALENNLIELIELGNMDRAEKITKIFAHLTEKEESLFKNSFLEHIAIKFADMGETRKAFEIASLIETISTYDHKGDCLDKIVRKIVKRENISAEDLFKEARSFYDGEVRPIAMRNICIKFAKEGNMEKALEIARSIKQPYHKTYSLLDISQLYASINEEASLNVIEETINTARISESPIFLLTDIALVLSWMGKHEKSTEIINEAIDNAHFIKSPYMKSYTLKHIVSNLIEIGKIEDAFEIASSIEISKERVNALMIIFSRIGQKEELKKNIEREIHKSIMEAFNEGIDFDTLYDIVKNILKTGLKIDLSEYSRDTEETGLFLERQKDHPTKVVIELGWVFKNMWLASNLYSKGGNDKKAKEVNEKLKWMGRFSPLNIRPLEDEKMNLFVERDELNILDKHIIIRNGGSIAICGERGSGKSTLINNYISKYKNDPDYLIVKMECSTYYDRSDFIRFLLQKVVEAIKNSEEFKKFKKEEEQEIDDLDEKLKFVITRDIGSEAQVGVSYFHAKLSEKKGFKAYDFTHSQIIATLRTVLKKYSHKFTRIFIIVDEFDKLANEEGEFRKIKYSILQDLRAVFSIEGVYFILIGLDKHFQFEVEKNEGKTIEDSAFDDIIRLGSDNEKTHYLLSKILEKRLKWLNLDELFDEDGKEEIVKMAKGSPRELIRLLSKAIVYWMDKGVHRFDQKTVEWLAQ